MIALSYLCLIAACIGYLYGAAWHVPTMCLLSWPLAAMGFLLALR